VPLVKLPPNPNIDIELEKSRRWDAALAEELNVADKSQRIRASVSGTVFVISQGGGFAQTLYDLAQNPGDPDGHLRLNKRLTPVLAPITRIHFDRMPTGPEVGAVQALTGDTPDGRLFPNVTHLSLSWPAQNQLLAALHKHHDDGKYKLYLRALAKIADVKEFCTDYDMRALDSSQLRHGMEELRLAWPNMAVHHVHHALDDIPYTMPGVVHEVVYVMTSWPFCNGPWTMDYEPSDVDANLDPGLDELEDVFEVTEIRHNSSNAETDEGRAKAAKRSQKRIEVFEKFRKMEQKNAAKAKANRSNAYTPWCLNIARTILEDCARAPRGQCTTWKATVPSLPPGEDRGNMNKAKAAMKEAIRQGLLEDAACGFKLACEVNDDEKLQRWVNGTIEFMSREPGPCEGCGKNR